MSKSALGRLLGPLLGTKSAPPDLRPEALLPGTWLGNVRIERRIASGGTATLYGAVDPAGLAVAVKALHWPEPGADEAKWMVGSEHFLKAGEQASRLEHPGIARVYGGGRVQGVAFIVMELLSGRDLSNYVRPGRLLPEPLVLEIASRLAQALSYAHRSGLVHRDVKPSNVMFDPATNLVKLTDFGLARGVDDQATRSGMLLGSPVYMAPELLAGGRADAASDLYALGVLVFELLTGRAPYTGASMGELLRGVAQAAPLSIAGLRPDLPEGHGDALDALLGTLLAKAPRERIADGEAWAGAARAVRARWQG